MHDGTHAEMLIAGKLNHFIPNPTFDPVIVPGCLDLQFRGQIPEGVDPRTLTAGRADLRRRYRDRDARIATMDEQGLDAVLLFPTLGCGVEQALRLDIPATMASLSAFNRWLDDDWGFSYQDRIIAAPMISLADPEAAVREIDWVLERGARIVHVRPAPVPTGGPKGRSLGDKRPRPGLGAARRGRRPGRVPPRRQRLQRACSARRGAAPRSSRRSASPTSSGR